MNDPQNIKAVENSFITIGELKEHLSSYPDDYTLSFSGLDFSQLKQRGDNRVNMEFNQECYRDASGRLIVNDIL